MRVLLGKNAPEVSPRRAGGRRADARAARIALAAVGGCGAGSPQEQWLRADLAAHPEGCLLAAWHQPRFSSGTHGDDPAFDAFWRALYEAGVDVVLNGHDHDYERFEPQDPDGRGDPSRGVREFVVGTGGKNQTPFATIRANSAARSSGTFGVLSLALHAGGYDWRFLPADGGPPRSTRARRRQRPRGRERLRGAGPPGPRRQRVLPPGARRASARRLFPREAASSSRQNGSSSSTSRRTARGVAKSPGSVPAGSTG